MSLKESVARRAGVGGGMMRGLLVKVGRKVSRWFDRDGYANGKQYFRSLIICVAVVIAGVMITQSTPKLLQQF